MKDTPARQAADLLREILSEQLIEGHKRKVRSIVHVDVVREWLRFVPQRIPGNSEQKSCLFPVEHFRGIHLSDEQECELRFLSVAPAPGNVATAEDSLFAFPGVTRKLAKPSQYRA
jgi:hypothetical protein